MVKLMRAEVQAQIARELVAVHEGAPIFLTRLLDTTIGQPLPLTSQQPQSPKGAPNG